MSFGCLSFYLFDLSYIYPFVPWGLLGDCLNQCLSIVWHFFHSYLKGILIYCNVMREKASVIIISYVCFIRIHTFDWQTTIESFQKKILFPNKITTLMTARISRVKVTTMYWKTTYNFDITRNLKALLKRWSCWRASYKICFSATLLRIKQFLNEVLTNCQFVFLVFLGQI